jgi:phytoene dehydrogenase-like protein
VTHTDVLVLGSGMAGLATAALLARSSRWRRRATTGGSRGSNARGGAAYGAEEKKVRNRILTRVPSRTPFRNLYLVNATAGWPSVCGAVRSGLRLTDALTAL